MKNKKPTLADYRAMSDKEFKQFVKVEYKKYIDFIEHEDDYISYDEYYTELATMAGRQS